METGPRTAFETAIAMAAAKAGDADPAASPTAFQAFEKLIRQINIVRVGTGGTAIVVVSIFTVMLLSDARVHFVSPRAAGWVIVVAVMFAFAAVATWPVIWAAGVPGFCRATLFADGLQPFHDLREAIASGRSIARRPDGGIHSAPLFESPWAISAFSRHEDVRRMRLPGSRMGIGDELLIDPSEPAEPIAEVEKQSEIAASLDRVTDRLDSVEKAVAKASVVKAKQPNAVQLHWYATVSEETHLTRAPDIVNVKRWHDVSKEQVAHALDKAFATTREDCCPRISAKDLAQEVANSLREAGLSIGLSETSSKVWLEKMFGSGMKNDYAFVRRYLTEPGYQLPYELPLSQ